MFITFFKGIKSYRRFFFCYHKTVFNFLAVIVRKYWWIIEVDLALFPSIRSNVMYLCIVYFIEELTNFVFCKIAYFSKFKVHFLLDVNKFSKNLISTFFIFYKLLKQNSPKPSKLVIWLFKGAHIMGKNVGS